MFPSNRPATFGPRFSLLDSLDDRVLPQLPPASPGFPSAFGTLPTPGTGAFDALFPFLNNRSPLLPVSSFIAPRPFSQAADPPLPSSPVEDRLEQRWLDAGPADF